LNMLAKDCWWIFERFTEAWT